jgi:adenylate cyclase
MAFAKLTNSDFDAVRRIIDTSLALPRQEPSLDSAVAFALGGLVEVCTGNRDKGLRQLRMGTDHARAMSPVGFSAILIYWGMLAGMGLHIADDLLDDLRGALADAHSFGDRFGIIAAQWAYGTILLRADPASRDEALRLLEEAGNRIRAHNLQVFALAIVDVDVALAKARAGDRDQAIDQLRALVRHHLYDGALFYLVRPAEALIELLTARGSSADLDEAAALIDEWRLRRTDAPTMNLWWQKSLALLAKARGESGRFAELTQEYWSAAVNLNVPSRAAEAQRMLGDLAGIRGG